MTTNTRKLCWSPGGRNILASTVVAATAIALAACGGEGSGADQAEDAAGGGSGYEGDIGETDLSTVCPDNVVVQTDWFPEAEHGHLYELLNYGGEGEDTIDIDAESKVVSGALFDADNGYTGIDLEVRSGGPAIGNQAVTSIMYQDPDIMLGYVDVDEAIRYSTDMPTTGVAASLDKSPQMIMWDPETYPDVDEIADLKDENATVVAFANNTFMDYLTGAGILDESQVDGSYDGAPATFVAAGGENAQQGYSSSEPYQYEYEVEGWNKPVEYQLIHDTGFPTYKNALSVKSSEIEEQSDCLSELVPVLQRGQASYMSDPKTTNELVVDIVSEFNAGWVYGDGNAEFGVEKLRDERLVSDGSDGTLGSFDESRLTETLNIMKPILADQDTEVKDGLSLDEVATNEFLDDSISLVR